MGVEQESQSFGWRRIWDNMMPLFVQRDSLAQPVQLANFSCRQRSHSAHELIDPVENPFKG